MRRENRADRARGRPDGRPFASRRWRKSRTPDGGRDPSRAHQQRARAEGPAPRRAGRGTARPRAHGVLPDAHRRRLRQYWRAGGSERAAARRRAARSRSRSRSSTRARSRSTRRRATSSSRSGGAACRIGASLAFDTARAFLQALTAERVLEAAARRLDRAKANLQNAEARAAAGLASTNDATRATLELATSAREVAHGDRARRRRAYLQPRVPRRAARVDRRRLAAPRIGRRRRPRASRRRAENQVQAALDRRPDVRAAPRAHRGAPSVARRSRSIGSRRRSSAQAQMRVLPDPLAHRARHRRDAHAEPHVEHLRRGLSLRRSPDAARAGREPGARREAAPALGGDRRRARARLAPGGARGVSHRRRRGRRGAASSRRRPRSSTGRASRARSSSPTRTSQRFDAEVSRATREALDGAGLPRASLRARPRADRRGADDRTMRRRREAPRPRPRARPVRAARRSSRARSRTRPTPEATRRQAAGPRHGGGEGGLTFAVDLLQVEAKKLDYVVTAPGHHRGLRARAGHGARRRRRRPRRVPRGPGGEEGRRARHRSTPSASASPSTAPRRSSTKAQAAQKDVEAHGRAPRRREREAPRPHPGRGARDLPHEDAHREGRHRGRGRGAQGRRAQPARLGRARADRRHHPDAHRRDRPVRADAATSWRRSSRSDPMLLRFQVEPPEAPRLKPGHDRRRSRCARRSARSPRRSRSSPAPPTRRRTWSASPREVDATEEHTYWLRPGSFCDVTRRHRRDAATRRSSRAPRRARPITATSPTSSRTTSRKERVVTLGMSTKDGWVEVRDGPRRRASGSSCAAPRRSPTGARVRSTRLTSMDARRRAPRSRTAARAASAAARARRQARGSGAGGRRAAARRPRAAEPAAVNITDVSIKNPVFAWMLMACTMLFGIVAITRVGISQYPDVDYPNISVSVIVAGRVAVGRRARDRRAARAVDLAGRGRQADVLARRAPATARITVDLRHVARRRSRAPGRPGRASARRSARSRRTCPAAIGLEVEPRRPGHPHDRRHRPVLEAGARRRRALPGAGEAADGRRRRADHAQRLPRSQRPHLARREPPRREGRRRERRHQRHPHASTSRCPAGSSRRAVARSTCASSARRSTSRRCEKLVVRRASKPAPDLPRGRRASSRTASRTRRRIARLDGVPLQALGVLKQRGTNAVAVADGGPRARRRDPAHAPRGHEGRGPLRSRRSSSRSRCTSSSSSSAWPSS